MSELEEELKVEISEEERDLIIKGIRPEGMSQYMFKYLRKASQDALKEYKKGRPYVKKSDNQ